MKIKTKELDEALSRLSLVAEKNTLDPMTSIVSFFTDGQHLIACATDKSNTLFYKLDCENYEDLAISVSIASFAKLIHSISTDTVELKVNKNILQVKGNGNYKFSSIVDGKGKNIMINDRRLRSTDVAATVSSSTIKSLKSQLAISLAPNDFAVVDYKDYYADGSNVLTTDTDNASIFRHGILDNNAYKLSNKLIDILAGLGDDFELVHENGLSAFRGTKCELVTKLVPAYTCPDFQAELFVNVFNKPMSFSIKLNKSELLAALNRCAIFTDSQVKLDFSNKLTIKTLDSSVVEKVESSENINKEITVSLSILMSYVKTLTDEDIYLEFDETENLLKLSDSQIEHILSSYA